MREVVQLLVEAEPKSYEEKLNSKSNISDSIWQGTATTQMKNIAKDMMNKTKATDTMNYIVATPNFLGLW